jgi:plasmid replication initiation protein
MARKKKKAPMSSLIVTQANKLVEARYNLSLGEQRLVMAMIAQVQPGDEDFKPYRISIAELAEFLGIDKGSAYRECKKLTKTLLSRVLEIQEEGRLIQINWASSADYVDGSGEVVLCCDPLLKPYLLNLQKDFTSCKLGILMRFKSQYTLRMYMLLKQYLKLTEREIELRLLREIMGLRKDQHVEYSNLH